MITLFHVSRHADQILADGFRDAAGFYGFTIELSGVFVSNFPVSADEAYGDVLVVELSDEFDLEQYAIVEEGAPDGWRREWLIPAEVLNASATVSRSKFDQDHDHWRNFGGIEPAG